MKNTNNNLKLYVWDDVLVDYSSGVMFALANNVEEAREVILDSEYSYNEGTIVKDLKQKPKVYQEPFGLAIWGGG